MLCELKIVLLGNSTQKKYKRPCKRKHNNTKNPIRNQRKKVKKEREMRFDSNLIPCINEFIEIDLSQILGDGKKINMNITKLQCDQKPF